MLCAGCSCQQGKAHLGDAQGSFSLCSSPSLLSSPSQLSSPLPAQLPFGMLAALSGECQFFSNSTSRKTCSHKTKYSPGEAMNMVTQSGSGSWLFSSSWEQGMWLWLFRGSGVQGRWGPGLGSTVGSRGAPSSCGLEHRLVGGGSRNGATRGVWGWGGVSVAQRPGPGFTQLELPGRWDLEKS